MQRIIHASRFHCSVWYNSLTKYHKTQHNNSCLSALLRISVKLFFNLFRHATNWYFIILIMWCFSLQRMLYISNLSRHRLVCFHSSILLMGPCVCPNYLFVYLRMDYVSLLVFFIHIVLNSNVKKILKTVPYIPQYDLLYFINQPHNEAISNVVHTNVLKEDNNIDANSLLLKIFFSKQFLR